MLYHYESRDLDNLKLKLIINVTQVGECQNFVGLTLITIFI